MKYSFGKPTLRYLISFELIYALYLLSGVLKVYLVVLKINLPDITMLLGVALCLIALKELFLNGLYINSQLLFASFCFVMLLLISFFSIVYTLSPHFFQQKLILFLTCAIAFFFPIFYKKFNMVIFIRLIVYLGIIFSILFLYYFPKLFFKEIDTDLDSLSIYLTLGYLVGLCLVLVIACYYLFDYSFSIIGCFFVVVLFSTGARGPLIFGLIVSLILIVVCFFDKQKVSATKVIFQFLVIFLLSLLFVIKADSIAQNMDDLSEIYERTFNRLELMISSDQGASIEGRKNQISLALDGIFENTFSFLFGYGFGSYGIFSKEVDELHHPHNIFLEMWFETGVFGMLLLGIFLFYCLYICWQKSRYDFILIMSYLILNSLKSSSIVQLRIMFGFLAVLLVSALVNEKTSVDN